MANRIPEDEQANYEIFRDCLSEPVLQKLAAPAARPKKKKRARKSRSITAVPEREKEIDTPDSAAWGEDANASDLGEFIDYLSNTIFPSLPPDLRTLTHALYKSTRKLHQQYALPLSTPLSTSLINSIPASAIDSLESYSLLPTASDTTDQHHFFTPVLSAYTAAATAAPPIWSTTRSSECELCARSWIPLTYHHLIPRAVHDRVLKRKWHTPDRLNAVAWLCRACHSFVHRMAGNEELARGFYDVRLIREGGVDGEKREMVEGWVKWVGGVRWKSR